MGLRFGVWSAGLIIFHLFGVRVAVDLDAEFGFGAIEVDDETIDGMLTAYLEAVKLAITQARPKFYFGGRLRLAQFARGLKE